MLKIHTIGGYNEVGKNMTALEIGNDVFLFDAGLYLPAIVGVEERERIPTERGMRSLGALPDDLYLDRNNLRNKVRALLVSHAHLDHVGGVQFLAHRYNAPVLGTPFTIEVLKTLAEDNKQQLKNALIPVRSNGSHIIKGTRDYKVEFINMTHSTIQSTIVAVHTPDGIVLYANDYKLDNTPVFGEPPNYARLKELSKIGVKALIVDCLYASDDRKTPSEKIARGLLEDVFFTTDNRKSGMIVTTFSSHIARLKSIVEFGRRLDREVVFVGRSLHKYVSAAQAVGKAPFRNQITMSSYRKQTQKLLTRISRQREKFLLVCTGHQGEPGSVLDRISRHELPYKFGNEDHIIFSSKTIPAPINELNRAQLEKRLKKQHVRIFDNVHVSVLPNTEVLINDSKGMKIKEIGSIAKEEEREMKVPAFDPEDLRIKWYDAKVIKHDYKGKIFNISTKSGRSVSITSGHSLFKLEKGEIVVEKGDNLQEGDYLAIPKKFSWHSEIDEIEVGDYLSLEESHYEISEGYIMYNKRKICPVKFRLTMDFARLLGYYLAEGSAPRHISLVIAKHEDDLLEEIKRSLAKCLPSNVNVADKGTSYEITFGARTLGRLFKGWFGENAKTKRIPKFVFSASNEFKLNFLGAYLNGDGCIDQGSDHFRIRMKTASKKLASDLLYIFSQVGICAKFDHIEVQNERHIAGNKNLTASTSAYVIRIQNINYLAILKDFLSDKFKLQIEDKMTKTKFSQEFPPESLPLKHINLDEVEPRKYTSLYDIKHSKSSPKKHMSQRLLAEQSIFTSGFIGKVVKGDLLFDPIDKIEVSNYDGPVYDFTVPGPENFIGGFGGIMLHNSGHGGKEDLRDLIKLTQPEHVIPSHGDYPKLKAGYDLAIEMGYKKNVNVHLLTNAQELKLS